MGRFLLALVVCATTSSCQPVQTQVLVEVDAEPAALEGVTHVRIRRFTTEGVFEQTEPVVGRGALPLVQPLQPDLDLNILLHIDLLAGEDLVSQQTVRTTFTANERRYVRIVFDADCRDVSCSGVQSCTRGLCEDACYVAEVDAPVRPTPRTTCTDCSPESCDGADNDCDGRTDEGDALPTACVGPGETTVFPDLQNANQDQIRVGRVQTDIAQDYTAVFMRLAPSGSTCAQSARPAIYADAAGVPGALLASGDDVEIALTTSEWVRLPLAASLPVGTYWVGLHTGAFDGVCRYANDAAPAEPAAYTAFTAFDDGAPPAAEWVPIERLLSLFLERAP